MWSIFDLPCEFLRTLKSKVRGSYVTTSGARIFNCALILDALRGIKGSMEPKAKQWAQQAKDKGVVARFEELVALAV